MYYTYVLVVNGNPRFYIGSTGDLRKRFRQHQLGHVTTTHNRQPKLVYYEAYVGRLAAEQRESKLKQRGKAWQSLRQRIANSM